jgi:dynactin complex subunit
MNQEQIKELLENEEMEVNESLYLKQLIEMEQQATTFLDRLIQEQKELQDKKIKLADFLSKGNVVDIVGEIQHKYLMLQLQTMETYNMILEMRILDLQSK